MSLEHLTIWLTIANQAIQTILEHYADIFVDEAEPIAEVGDRLERRRIKPQLAASRPAVLQPLDNCAGELGIGVIYSGAGKSDGTNTPVQVIGLTNPASLSGAGFFSLALMSNGTVRAWGQGLQGECGNGTTGRRDGR